MTRKIRLGVVGLGRAFMLMLPTFLRDQRVELVAAADPRHEARARFTQEFGGRAYDSAEALAADKRVEAIYIASPHQHHAEHVEAAARCGRHVLVEKPIAVTLEDAERMVAAIERAGVHLIVGHSHSFNAPILRTRELIASGRYGAVRMITALNFTDFLYRPRRPEELDSAQGGGVVFSQGAHQVDIVRLLGGGLVRSVRAVTGDFDPARRTEGAYQALLTFADGTSASLAYSGYARFDTDELMGWIGEMGVPRDPDQYGAARAALLELEGRDAEIEAKRRRTYGSAQAAAQLPPHHNHFGFIVASCEGADLRPTARGVTVFADDARSEIELPAPSVSRREVIDELFAAVAEGVRPLHNGRWGLATLEVCRAILISARESREILLERQVAAEGRE